jgi:hypothetical protein
MDAKEQGRKMSRRTLLLSGVAAALAANGVWVATRFIRSKADIYELSFSGPFRDGQELIQPPAGTPWLALDQVAISGPEIVPGLALSYQFKGKEDPNRRIRVCVSVTTKDGQLHTVSDEPVFDARLLRPMRVGSHLALVSHVNSESIRLPGYLSDINKVNVRFEPLEADGNTDPRF